MNIIFKTAGVAAAILAVALGLGTAGATNSKVTLCHNGHTITISEHALDGHFDHDGQPAVGHEDDYLGACVVDDPPVDEPPVDEPPAEEPPVVAPPAKTSSVVIVAPAPAAAPTPAAPAFTG